MGWARGSDIATDMVDAIAHSNIPIDDARKLYKRLIHSLESNDWDTQDEAMGIDPVFDEVMRDIHPDWEI